MYSLVVKRNLLYHSSCGIAPNGSKKKSSQQQMHQFLPRKKAESVVLNTND
jgi:hypothetical protein